jgi:hypothetical protein
MTCRAQAPIWRGCQLGWTGSTSPVSLFMADCTKANATGANTIHQKTTTKGRRTAGLPQQSESWHNTSHLIIDDWIVEVDESARRCSKTDRLQSLIIDDRFGIAFRERVDVMDECGATHDRRRPPDAPSKSDMPTSRWVAQMQLQGRRSRYAVKSGSLAISRLYPTGYDLAAPQFVVGLPCIVSHGSWVKFSSGPRSSLKWLRPLVVRRHSLR